ncbi:hypothetical protein K501DRAFT_331251 [Backusella circina FSU 941]|nr:hypothetical protein K501DRAFT_331251 [Backusella circina FSU 941]
MHARPPTEIIQSHLRRDVYYISFSLIKILWETANEYGIPIEVLVRFLFGLFITITFRNSSAPFYFIKRSTFESTSKERLAKYWWSKAYLGLAFFQVIIALGLILPVFANVRHIKEQSSGNKPEKVYLESIAYLFFEVWRLWLVLDGIVQMNSLTIYATAVLTVFSFGLSVSACVESVRWADIDQRDYSLLMINRNLQIALSVIVFLLIFPNLWVAHFKLTKDFGWGVYKKIGGSVMLQRIYKTVQWFSLILKLDIFFEFIFLVLFMTATRTAYDRVILTNTYFILAIILCIAMLVSLPMVREAIARESHVLMGIFLCIQTLFVLAVIITLSRSSDSGKAETIVHALFIEWYEFAIYFVLSLIMVIVTIVAAILCQVNFGKGLRPHVQWRFLGLRKTKNGEDPSNQVEVSNGLLFTKVDMPIDDD